MSQGGGLYNESAQAPSEGPDEREATVPCNELCRRWRPWMGDPATPVAGVVTGVGRAGIKILLERLLNGGARSDVVYRSVTAAGKVQYVGITNNLARRAAEHLTSRGIQVEKVLGGLSRSDARAVEQALIEIHGLGKNGGTLLNRINSIAPSSPAYAQQVQRGYELLKSIGYR